MFIFILIYIYIYIYRERERDTHIYIYIYIHINNSIYIINHNIREPPATPASRTSDRAFMGSKRKGGISLSLLVCSCSPLLWFSAVSLRAAEAADSPFHGGRAIMGERACRGAAGC